MRRLFAAVAPSTLLLTLSKCRTATAVTAGDNVDVDGTAAEDAPSKHCDINPCFQRSSVTDVFCRIMRGEAPCTLRYSDEKCIAIDDLHPVAPVHILVIPKKHVSSVTDMDDDAGDDQLIGHLVLVAKKLAVQCGFARNGYRLVLNSGAHAGQSVNHIHLHILGGRPLRWPPG